MMMDAILSKHTHEETHLSGEEVGQVVQVELYQYV